MHLVQNSFRIAIVINTLSLVKLGYNSTLVDIESHSFQVDVNSLGKVIKEKFQKQPEFPGVIITNNSEVVGMLSRRKFIEQMSQPYSLELYLERPIKHLLNFTKNTFLQLACNCTIEEAVKIALNRPKTLVYEPIIVLKAEELSLLDVHTLLLAQTQILAEYNNLIQIMQASLVATHFGEQHTEFTQIIGQINSLEGKTHDASTQANQIANRFQFRIQELTKVAQEGQNTAFSLIQENQIAQNALMELEQLVNQSTVGNG